MTAFAQHIDFHWAGLHNVILLYSLAHNNYYDTGAYVASVKPGSQDDTGAYVASVKPGFDTGAYVASVASSQVHNMTLHGAYIASE